MEYPDSVQHFSAPRNDHLGRTEQADGGYPLPRWLAALDHNATGNVADELRARLRNGRLYQRVFRTGAAHFYRLLLNQSDRSVARCVCRFRPVFLRRFAQHLLPAFHHRFAHGQTFGSLDSCRCHALSNAEGSKNS